ncbi:MAG: hypothetical protein IPL61_29985 [Myxococcales bacterium]|nr:hypothetical protein [Myxococcales bacterium]
MRWPLVVVASSLIACGSSKQAEPGQAGPAAAPAKGSATATPGKVTMSKFTLNVDGEPPVAVELAVPAGWKADTSAAAPDGPSWTTPGARLLMLAAIAPSGGDDEVRMRKAIRMQYDDGEGAERTELAGGRVWMVRTEGENLHARMFVPYERGVVMGVAMMAADASAQLPAIRAAFETLTIAAAP